MFVKYFILDHQRNGSCYHEFYKGKWDGKTFWKSDSIFLHDDCLFLVDGFVDTIIDVVPYYDPYGETEISIDQWNKMSKIITRKDAKSQEVYYEADRWLKEQVFPEHKCFTILGI